MSENRVINQTIQPLTRSTFAQKCQEIGIEEGMTVIVHASLSQLGWVCGGPVAVIQALQDVLTSSGTLVMPTHTPNISDPKEWNDLDIPESWWNEIRREMPAFDRDATPVQGMGQIAETFRTMPGVVRSDHPRYSFAAWGKNKAFVTQNHSLDNGMGELSPVGKIYALDGFVLLLGVGHESNTSMHLGEHKSMQYGILDRESPILENGVRVWRTFTELDYNDEVFETIGQAFENEQWQKSLSVGNAEMHFMNQRDIVSFTSTYIQDNQLK